ncbi:MAG: F0F1 ATP synthase subunit delta [Pseudomonadota bacterium]
MAAEIQSPAVSGVAGRYASALFDLAKERGDIEGVEAELGRFEDLVNANDDLRRLIMSPAFSAQEQVKGMMAVLERAGIGGLAANFIGLVARNRRLFVVLDMVKAYRAFASAERGEVTALVTSAEPLSDAQEQSLRDALREAAGSEVSLSKRVDPDLIGGLVVQLGSRQIDTSLRTRLASMRKAMIQAPVQTTPAA